MVFENYKSLDESLPSGLSEDFRPPTGLAAAALEPAIKLYSILHDVLSPEAQLRLCGYFQVTYQFFSKINKFYLIFSCD